MQSEENGTAAGKGMSTISETPARKVKMSCPLYRGSENYRSVQRFAMYIGKSTANTGTLDTRIVWDAYTIWLIERYAYCLPNPV